MNLLGGTVVCYVGLVNYGTVLGGNDQEKKMRSRSGELRDDDW